MHLSKQNCYKLKDTAPVLIKKAYNFVQKLSPITGHDEWVVQNEDYDYHQEVARAAFADMLHDKERNEKYEQALKVAINRMHERGKKANVLDIGTGTGLLSMMAVRHGADSVTACEAFEPMAKCATQVIKLNECYDQIKLISKRSTDLIVGVDMEFKANILVTEVFDTELIGEGAFGTFKHAHEYLLETDCIVIPHRATIYAQVVGGDLIKNWNRLNDIYDDNNKLLLKVPEGITNCEGSINLHDLQLSQLPLESVTRFTEAIPIFKFDWSKKSDLQFERISALPIKVDESGVACGVFMWWDLNMDFDNNIILSCAPYWGHPLNSKDKVPWRDHWMQSVYYLPQEIRVEKDKDINLISCHDEFSLWFDLSQSKFINADSPKCTCGLHYLYSRTRIGQLNDPKRISSYIKAIQNNVKPNHNILILSHSFYLALIAAKICKKVYCLESNRVSKGIVEDFIKTNELSNVEIINEQFEGMENIDLVFGEPYFLTSIVPWDDLRFLYLLKKFSRFFDKNVEIIPRKAVIKAVAVEFDHLHKIRSALDRCQGFIMEPFDNLIESSSELTDDQVEAQPLWEYPCKALSEVEIITTIDLKAPDESYCINRTINIENPEKCNGIAVWVDWILDDSCETVTSGPTKPIKLNEYISWDMHIRQGVVLLGNETVVNNLGYSFMFDLNKGCINFNIINK